MKRGKKICNTLKEVRMQVAKANDIKYAPSECHHEGDCAGTCPKCEAEVRWLEQQLQLRRQLGKAVAVVGVSMGHASFPGGQSALLTFLKDNIKYPEQAKKDSIEGRVVIIFNVETDGSITEPKVVRSVHPLLDAEALRVAKLMPKWEPAYQNDTPVKTKYNIPITFKMGEPETAIDQ